MVPTCDPILHPIEARTDRSLILDPDEFYILASTEAVQVPPDFAAEMVPFDPLVGEFRVHYAGFFDPGFGYAGAGGLGSRAVLEVRSREVPFILEHGQIVGHTLNSGGSYMDAFIWSEGAGMRIITSPGVSFIAAAAVNDLGQVVGQSGSTRKVRPTMMSSRETMNLLSLLPSRMA